MGGKGQWGALGVLTRGCPARHTAAAASLLPVGTAGAVRSSLLVCLEGERWGESAAPHPPAGTPNPVPSPPPPAPPRHGCGVRASTGEQLPHPPSCPRGGMGGDRDNRGRGCWGQGGPRGQGWAGEVTLCSIPTWDSASGLHRCTHRTTCGDYEVPQTSPTSLWPHPLPQVASFPPVPSCHVQWTCSFCVVDLSEFCKDSWSTVQVTSASLSSLVTRNSTRLLTVKVFPLESSTTSVPSAAGTGGGWRRRSQRPHRGLGLMCTLRRGHRTHIPLLAVEWGGPAGGGPALGTPQPTVPHLSPWCPQPPITHPSAPCCPSSTGAVLQVCCRRTGTSAGRSSPRRWAARGQRFGVSGGFLGEEEVRKTTTHQLCVCCCVEMERREMWLRGARWW